MRANLKGTVGIFVLAGVGALWSAFLPAAETSGVEIGPVGTAKLSVPLGSLKPVLGAQGFVTKSEDRLNPLAHLPGAGKDRLDGVVVLPDALAPSGFNPAGRTPTPFLTFAGTGNPVGCNGCSPPDTVGDVGPKHYIQMVNATKIAVYSKTGGAPIAGPYNLSDLWSSGACNGDDGDPVVSYDPLADRWVLAQFAGPANLCFAVSQTADPLGSYWIYNFSTTNFPDYFKVGVWPDGYYVGTNESDYSAWVFERVPMLSGAAARSLKSAFASDNFLMPADVDGIVAPPPGAPGYFYTFLDNTFHGGSDRIELYSFAVSWAGTPSGTFATAGTIPLTAFGYTVCNFFDLTCAPQGGTAQLIDVVSEWPMFRLAYRNFGTSERLAGNFTVNVGAAPPNGRAGIRWFELGRSGGVWTLAREGTYDPGATGFRYMGSYATDYYGNAALGYTFSSAAESPDIRIATRLAGDPAGTLGLEVTMTNGTGSQTGSSRWGDYSALSIDPADDCTFWFTNEFYSSSSSSTWSTRIGAFRIPECPNIYIDNFETGSLTRWSAVSPP